MKHTKALRWLTALTVGMTFLASTVLAQTTQRIRGTITAFDGRTLEVKTREGRDVKIAVPENVAVGGMYPIALGDIKPGSYVGAASMKQADGSLKALEVLVFPEASRGSNEGHTAWDLQPESNMTNATVSAMVEGNTGRELTLQYKGGSQKIVVPQGVPIVTFSPADKSLLKPGTRVFIGAQVAADGSYSASRVTAGRDGMKPPM